MDEIQLAKEIAHLSIEIAKMNCELKELIRKRDDVIVRYAIKREQNEKDSTKSN